MKYIKILEKHGVKCDYSTLRQHLTVCSVIVIAGHETIWHTVGAEKALRAFSRGQPDVMPEVRTVANKFDPRTNAILLPIRR